MARLAHHVFFLLKDRNPAAIEALAASCEKYLNGHDGVEDFSVGTRDHELNRPVNLDFDVSLHLVFRDRAAHDAYQTLEQHLTFIAQNKDSWQQITVCDSYLR